MYFITDKPKMFNAETGVVIYMTEHHVLLAVPGTPSDQEQILHIGTSQECEDFIYSLAGWVGAVNPTVKGGGG